MTRVGISMIFLSLYIISSFVFNAESVAVMSVDLGSEWMKVAIVSSGVPMEIVLNKESHRKTPTIIAFRDSERTIGDDAKNIGLRFPQYAYSYILDLVGKSINHPIVSLYSKRFPHHEIIPVEDRGTIAFKLNSETLYTPEELLAQLLHEGKQYAEASAKQSITDAVIIVPGFFNQIERAAIIQSAELANIKVLQLMNDYMAVALTYAISHRKEINDTAHYVIFYDMGASSTTATVVAYQNIKVKEKGIVETHPHVNVLGVGYNRTLGGLEIQIRLRDYLAKQFDALNKTSQSVFDNPRAMAKLFQEAGRVKNILSANIDHYAQVEGLIAEHDFKLKVTRQDLEDLCSDIFQYVTNPIQIALETSGLSLDVISHVVLAGAGTRMPKIQDILSNMVRSELGKNINTDEAAALGAVYKAADLSQGFKVKKFITRDAVVFPIQIVFDRVLEDNVKQVRRTLFNRMNAYPQKKIITFNKHTDDFTFHVNYAELDYLSVKEIEALGSTNLSTVTLTGVSEALKKHAAEETENKGIKAHFAMDESGLLNLLSVESVAEKASAETDKEEGTFSKLGSTISKLFTASEDKENQANGGEGEKKEDIKPVYEEPEYPESINKNNQTNSTNAKESEQTLLNKTEKVDKEKKVTLITLKEPIKAHEIKLGPKSMTEEQFNNSYEKIRKLHIHEMEKSRRETALNNLESYVLNAQGKLNLEEYVMASTPEELEKIKKVCSEISTWLDDDGYNAPTEQYEEKLKDIQKLTHDLYERVHEFEERPNVISRLSSTLNVSSIFLTKMKNLSLTSDIFTTVEIESLEKIINETVEYNKTIQKSYEETPLYEPVKYKIRDVFNKISILDREMKYFMNKVKIWRPKTPETVQNQTDKSTGEEKVTTPEENNEEKNDNVTEEPSPKLNPREDL